MARKKRSVEFCPLTQDEMGTVVARLHRVGRLFNTTPTLRMVACDVAQHLHRTPPVGDAARVALIRAYIAMYCDGVAGLRHHAPVFQPLQREHWTDRIPARRQTSHLPTIVANKRIWRDGSVEVIS